MFLYQLFLQWYIESILLIRLHHLCFLQSSMNWSNFMDQVRKQHTTLSSLDGGLEFPIPNRKSLQKKLHINLFHQLFFLSSANISRNSLDDRYFLYWKEMLCMLHQDSLRTCLHSLEHSWVRNAVPSRCPGHPMTESQHTLCQTMKWCKSCQLGIVCWWCKSSPWLGCIAIHPYSNP